MWNHIAQGFYLELCTPTLFVTNTSHNFPAISGQWIGLPSYPTYKSWITQMHIQWCYSLVTVLTTSEITVISVPLQLSVYVSQCCIYRMTKTIHLPHYRGVLCLRFVLLEPSSVWRRCKLKYKGQNRTRGSLIVYITAMAHMRTHHCHKHYHWKNATSGSLLIFSNFQEVNLTLNI